MCVTRSEKKTILIFFQKMSYGYRDLVAFRLHFCGTFIVV